MRCKCYPPHIAFEQRHGKDTAGWYKKPGYMDNWSNCPERAVQAYDLLTNCSVIMDKLNDPEAIVEELALVGITKPAEIAQVQQIIIDKKESESDEEGAMNSGAEEEPRALCSRHVTFERGFAASAHDDPPLVKADPLPDKERSANSLWLVGLLTGNGGLKPGGTWIWVDYGLAFCTTAESKLIISSEQQRHLIESGFTSAFISAHCIYR